MNATIRIPPAALLLLLLFGAPCIPGFCGQPDKSAVTITSLGRLLPADAGKERREVCAAFGLNDKGQVVGRAATGPAQDAGIGHAMLSVNGKMTDLGLLPGYQAGSCALAINESGEIVGYSGRNPDDVDSDETHAFLYSHGRMTDLGALGGAYSKAVSINKSGVIAGISSTASGEKHAFICERGKMRDLGSYKGFKYFDVYKINDSGEVVGSMSPDKDGEHPRAFYYKAGVIHDLGTFGGESSVAHSVNNAGDIVGEFSVKGKRRAFLFTGGKMIDLTSSVDTRDSLGAIATEINNRGEILLMVPMNDHSVHNYIYRKGTAVDLRALLGAKSGYFAESVAGINDAGRLICFGTTPEGESGFLVSLGGGW